MNCPTVDPSGRTVCAKNSSSMVVIPAATASNFALMTSARARQRWRPACSQAFSASAGDRSVPRGRNPDDGVGALRLLLDLLWRQVFVAKALKLREQVIVQV